MNRIIVSRHGESVDSARGTTNGDPATDEGLSEAGREQARALGQEISGEPIDLCVTSEFPRTRETAALALAGHGIACSVDARLNDLRYGNLEGMSREVYRAWKEAHSLSTPLPGGESRVQVAARLCAAMEDLLARPEQTILVVTHDLLIGHLLNAVGGRTPAQPHPDISYATPYRLGVDEVRRAVALLKAWLGREQGAPSP
jgi:probable phosphoglycerate mutase